VNTFDTLFALLRQTVTGTPAGERPPEEVEYACRLAHMHDLLHLMGVAEGSCAPKVLEAQGQALYRSERLSYTLDRLCEVLEEAGVPHIPLKGAVLRHTYPEVWMRTTCDIDILIPEQDLDRACACLQNTLHWELVSKGSHDRCFNTESDLHVELHYSLIEDGVVKNATAVLSRAWQMSTPAEGCTWRHEMPDAFFYFYHIAHTAKHMQNGGCGIRSILDVWMMHHRMQGDEEGRRLLLEEGGLRTFSDAVTHLSEVWFSGAPFDDSTRRLTTYILRGGAYGEMDNRLLIQRLSKGRCGYLRSRLFTSYDRLCYYYPVIKGRRWLIPYGQLRRWFRLLVPRKRRQAMEELRRGRELISGTNTSEIAAICQDLGLE